MLGSGKIDVGPLITQTFPFKDSLQAFEFAKRPPPGSVKVQIELPA
jgi:D-xylulose reductase